MHVRNLSISMFAWLVLWAAPGAAQTISVTLDPQGEQLGPIATGDVVHFHHWGTVLYAGQPVGTYLIRRDAANIDAPAAIYPTQSVWIWIRITGVDGAFAMHGTLLTGTSSEPYVGSALVIPAGLDFLRGASFSLTRLPFSGIDQHGALTLQY